MDPKDPVYKNIVFQIAGLPADTPNLKTMTLHEATPYINALITAGILTTESRSKALEITKPFHTVLLAHLGYKVPWWLMGTLNSLIGEVRTSCIAQLEKFGIVDSASG